MSTLDAEGVKRAKAAIGLVTGGLADLTHRMQDGEADFVTKMAERIEQYGEQTFVSPKQLAWLEKLEEKYL